MSKTLVETYRGCDIYYLTPPDVSTAEYNSPCILGGYTKITAVYKRICAATGGTWVDEDCMDEEPPEPIPPLEPYLEEVYRGVEIWWVPTISAFRAEVAPGYVAVATGLIAVREQIDDILAFLYPPEDPEDGLFAQIVAAIKAWLMPIWTPLSTAWDSFITYTWPALGVALTGLGDQWDAFKSETLPAITGALTSLGDAWGVFWTETLPGIGDAIDEVSINLRERLNKKADELRASIDEGLADNREWAENFFKLMDPTGFLKDPLGYINAAFAIQGEIANTLAVKSFWEGFEEGLVSGEED